MRRRKFEVKSHVVVYAVSGPRTRYYVVRRRPWLARLAGFPSPPLHAGDTPAECFEWIERYRQAEKTAAEFRG